MPKYSVRRNDEGDWEVGYESRGEWMLYGIYSTENHARVKADRLNGTVVEEEAS